MSKNKLTIALIAALILGGSAAAQTVNTTVNGTVRDEAGQSSRGESHAPGHLDPARGDGDDQRQGGFVFTDVRPGGYLVAAEREGFKKAEVRDVQVDVNVAGDSQRRRSPPGQIADVVTTTASDAQSVVNTENGALQTTVFERQINDLPLNARNPLDLASLQPGCQPERRQPRGDGQRPARHLLQHHLGRDQHPGQLHPRPTPSSPRRAERDRRLGVHADDAERRREDGLGRGAGQAGHAARLDRLPRAALRVPPQRRLRRQLVLQQRHRRREGEAHPQPVRLRRRRARSSSRRRSSGRSASTPKALLLRLLRGDARADAA